MVSAITPFQLVVRQIADVCSPPSSVHGVTEGWAQQLHSLGERRLTLSPGQSIEGPAGKRSQPWGYSRWQGRGSWHQAHEERLEPVAARLASNSSAVTKFHGSVMSTPCRAPTALRAVQTAATQP
jgi:hypothetical protein